MSQTCSCRCLFTCLIHCKVSAESVSSNSITCNKYSFVSCIFSLVTKTDGLRRYIHNVFVAAFMIYESSVRLVLSENFGTCQTAVVQSIVLETFLVHVNRQIKRAWLLQIISVYYLITIDVLASKSRNYVNSIIADQSHIEKIPKKCLVISEMSETIRLTSKNTVKKSLTILSECVLCSIAWNKLCNICCVIFIEACAWWLIV